MDPFLNPFRPGAGHKPPYLAGRHDEQEEFRSILVQKPVMKNLIITGLRGVGKTVLLETLRPIALQEGWLWAGTDLSESASISEQSLSIRIIADIATLSSPFAAGEYVRESVGFSPNPEKIQVRGSFQYLMSIYQSTPGLEADKLKAVLLSVWGIVKGHARGVVLAYDEAQILKDHAEDKQYPLSLLLEVVQYLQRLGTPFLLVLTGLPTLFPNLVSARTYAERMFHVLTIDRLSEEDSRKAIEKPIENDTCPVKFASWAIEEIVLRSGGYPYFIQFICKEAYDSYIQQKSLGIASPKVYLNEIIRKLDTDFYAGRWGTLTDRQRDVLQIIAFLPNAEEEFSVSDIAEQSKSALKRPLSPSHINQILSKLVDLGLVYKNRHGKYSFAVPLFSSFIQRLSSNAI